MISIYRKVFCRGGHGVHSPYVFNLITGVIEERRHYYCYAKLHRVRRTLRRDKSAVRYGNRETTVGSVLEKYCFSEREDRLLFRLANHFKPRTILVAGSDFGLLPLYLTAYSRDTRCTVLEREPTVAAVARQVTGSHAEAVIEVTEKADAGYFDFIVRGKAVGGKKASADELFGVFKSYLQYVKEESVMIIPQINESPAHKQAWRMICNHPEVTVSIDLYSLGMVMFYPKLHRRTYKSMIP